MIEIILGSVHVLRNQLGGERGEGYWKCLCMIMGEGGGVSGYDNIC